MPLPTFPIQVAAGVSAMSWPPQRSEEAIPVRVSLVTEHSDRPVAGLSAALRQLGHDVDIHAGQSHVGQPIEPVEEELLGRAKDFGARLAGQWRQRQPDVVHSHSRLAGMASLLAAREFDVPVVHAVHGVRSGERNRLDRLVVGHATRIVATSTDEVLELIRFGARRTRVSVIPCGVDLETFTPSGPATRRGERVRLLSVGDLHADSGHDVAIAALTRLPGTELLIAGGPDGASLDQHDMACRLRKFAEHYRVGDRVALLGHVPHKDMPALLRSADAVICARTEASSGIVALEAMAVGVAVVATATGGLRDTVIDNVTGLHVPPRDPLALAKALRPLVADPMRRGAYGAAGRDRVRARYSWERVALDTVEVYRRAGAVPEEPVALQTSNSR